MASPASPLRQAVLLTGGLGTRLRPLTDRLPKALVPLLNRPLISYELELLARAGVTDIILAVSYKADALRQGLGDGAKWGVKLRYCPEPVPLDTAGAIANARDYLEDDFLVLNGDLVMDVDVAAVARAHLEKEADVTILLRRVEDIRPYGLIQRDDDGFIVAFREKVCYDETGQNTVNAGLYVMSHRVLEAIPAGRPYSNERQLFPGLLAKGARLVGYLPPRPGYWADVGRLDSYLQANRALLQGAIDWVRPQVQSEVSPQHVEPPVCIGAHCTIAGDVGPYACIGNNCQVCEGARLHDCVVLDGARIGKDAKVSNAVVGPDAYVPAGANITSGVFMPDD